MNYRVGELHTVMNIVDLIYVKLFQVAKYLYLQLVKAGFLTAETNKTYEVYASLKDICDSSSTPRNRRLLRNAYNALIEIQGP